MGTRDPAEFLKPSDREALQRACRALGVPLDAWRRIRLLRGVYETLAVQAEADRVQDELDCGRGTAVEEAACRVGVNEDTHRTRLKRALRDSLRVPRRKGQNEPGADAAA